MRFVSKLKSMIYLSRARVLLRRVGMRRALMLIGKLRSRFSPFEHQGRTKEYATARLGEFTANFRTRTSHDSRLVETLGGEKKFLDRLIGEVRPGDTACDIGASFGLYTVFLSKAVGPEGNVIGFEPERRSFQRCWENVELNSLKNVQLFDRALANEDKRSNLVVDENSTSGVHHVFQNGNAQTHLRLQPTQMVVGDQFFSQRCLPIPNVVKIDVEGMEEEVLLGLTQTLRHLECRVVLCEVHFAILDQRGCWDAPGRIVKFLDSCGFMKIDWLNSGHCLAVKSPANPS